MFVDRMYGLKTCAIVVLLSCLLWFSDAATFPSSTHGDPFCNISKTPPLPHMDSSPVISGGPVPYEYIVTFKTYMPHTEHARALSDLLGVGGWEIVVRKNPAWNLPTDFSLIKLVNTTKEFVVNTLAALSASSYVRHVVPQKRYFNPLQQVLKEENGEELPFTPMEEDQEQSPSGIPRSGMKNITGKIFSSFPEEERPGFSTSRKLHTQQQLPEILNAHFLWEKGFTGQGVKIAVFDTGLRATHPHFRNIVDITNWTEEGSTDDGVGHGTFVAGVIASQTECLGFAPDADLYIFRVFTNNRVSYTSWFLDAFNYAIHYQIDVLNLSIGGPDFNDRPFVEKVWELTANNVVVVSAIGNDGPLYGTLTNPADQSDVIGVGGIDFGERLASFSSRGMTTWELPDGYGRVKPDIVAFGQSVQGSRIYGGCRSLSGTSVASPVVAGAVTLLMSTIPQPRRSEIINPASMKQVIVQAADRIPDANIFEQGMGKLNVLNSYELLSKYTPHASCIPSTLDLTQCPYFWPYCQQPLYHGAIPTIVNLTILNGMGVSGEIVKEPEWKPGNNGEMLEINFSYPDLLWPWTGYLGVHVRVHSDAAKWEGNAEGLISFTIISPPGPRETEHRASVVEVPVKVHIIPTPPRSKRILWDQYHNLRYPSGYFPRDALDIHDDPFDWNADHIHTNFMTLFNHLSKEGYFIEVLGAPFTCFDATQYSTLLIVDPEEEFFPVEIKKMKHDIEELGLSVVVFADWYNVDLMNEVKFFDENTRQWWTPATGGSNVPALNDLLKDFGIAFGDRVYNGHFDVMNHAASTVYLSGTSIAQFPVGGSMASFYLDDQTEDILYGRSKKSLVPVLGLYPPTEEMPNSGKIAVFGDSSCMDDASKADPKCLWLISSILQFVTEGGINPLLAVDPPLKEAFKSEMAFPERAPGNSLHKFSKVIGHTASCKSMNFKRYNKTEGETLVIAWEDTLPPKGTNTGKFRERSLFRDPVPPQRATLGRILLPYVVGCAVTVFLVIGILKWRKDRGLLRRSEV